MCSGQANVKRWPHDVMEFIWFIFNGLKRKNSRFSLASLEQSSILFSYSFLLFFVFFSVYFLNNFNIHFISFCLIGNNMRYWGLSFPFPVCFASWHSVAISYFSDYCKQCRENWRKLKSITILMAFIFIFYLPICSASKPLQFWQAVYWSYSH